MSDISLHRAARATRACVGVLTRRLCEPGNALSPVVVAALLLAGICATPTLLDAATVPAAIVEVSIAKFAYVPKEITIKPGTRVVWTNHDETPHTVTSTDKSFASKGLDTDDKFEHVFANEGDFGYICTLHPFMTGVVHVHKTP